MPLSLRVNRAIDRGVAHLRQDWCQPKAYQIYLGLLGLTLLECGAPRNDPAVVRIADLIRSQKDIDATQELSLALLFLDRLGDPKDDALIRTFARRLLEGQNDSGAWGHARIRRPASLPAGGKSPPAPFGWVKALPGDNLNTQWAVLGLWAARRHGVSVDKALRSTAQHFRKSQGDDGSWTYGPNVPTYRNSMTCAGLFCLAAEVGDRSIPPKTTIQVDDSAIANGLRFLGKSCDAIAKGGAPDAWDWLHFLWSLERVSAAYGLEKIGSQQWYPWAAELLLRRQHDDGSWRANGTPDAVPTCLALLILRRSNLTPDLFIGAPGTTQPRKPLDVARQPLVKEPSASQAAPPNPGLESEPRADRSAELPVYRPPVHAPDQTLTLNVRLRNADAWPNVRARLKALLGSPKGEVKLDTIAGEYYWVRVAPVKGDADVFARKVKFARVVAVHNKQRLIYLDSGR
jgi:hypothetical protein